MDRENCFIFLPQKYSGKLRQQLLLWFSRKLNDIQIKMDFNIFNRKTFPVFVIAITRTLNFALFSS